MLRLALAIVGVVLGLAQQPSPSKEIKFDDALALAAKDKRVVLIDFYTTWCGPCAMLDKYTWTDPAVVQWLGEKCVALRMDAEKEVDLATRFKVDAYPTIVLLKSDGKEIDRLVGYFKPKSFLYNAAAVIAGKSAEQREKEEPPDEDDPSKRQDHGRALSKQGKFAEALAEYLWCFDHGEEDDSYGGVRRSFLLADIVFLGGKYPPALKALQDRRDAAEARLVKGSESFDDLADLISLNEYLKTPERSLALFDRLKAAGPPSDRFRDSMLLEFLQPLGNAKRFADLFWLMPDPEAFVEQMIEDDSTLGDVDDDATEEDKAEAARDFAETKQREVVRLAIVHEGLLATDREDLAHKIAERLIKFDPSGSTYAALIDSAGRAHAADEVRVLGERGLKEVSEKEKKTVERAITRNTESK